MKSVIAFLLVLVSISAIPAQARPEAIVNYENQVIKRFDTKVLSLEEVQKCIREAAGKLNWRVEPGEPGHIIATLVIRNQHTAVVDIAYSQKAYSINYKSSINLNYGEDSNATIFGKDGIVNSSTADVIHPNYNKWVGYLNDAIFRELQQ